MNLSRKASELCPSPLAIFFEKAAATPGAISLAAGEFNEPIASHIIKAVARIIEEEQEMAKLGLTGSIKYTPASGLSKLRALIAKKHGCSIDNVAVGAGSKPLLSQAISLLVNPEASVIIPSPYYPYYRNMASNNRNEEIRLNTNKTNFRVDPYVLAKILKIVKKNVRNLLILNSPNNPTGTMQEKAELEEISKIINDNNMYVLADESYAAITYEGAVHTSFASLPGMDERTVSIRSFSKEYNMTGLRVGYAIGPKDFIAKLRSALEAFEGCASFLSQEAAIAALEGPQDVTSKMISKLSKRRKLLMGWLDKHNVSYPQPDGAFYVFADIPKRMGMSSEQFAEFLLQEAGVIVTPGTAFGQFEYVRISYAAVPQKELELAIIKMEAALKNRLQGQER